MNPANPSSVPMLDLVRQYHSIRSEIDAAIGDVLKSGEFILGPHVKRFEDAAAAYCRVKHAIGLASGTDALLLSLRALGIGPGDAVLVPSFTFFATAGTVHNVGATPVFCDIDPKTYNIDPASARAVLAARAEPRTANRAPSATDHGPRTAHSELRTPVSPSIRAIIPVHLYGQMADMDEVRRSPTSSTSSSSRTPRKPSARSGRGAVADATNPEPTRRPQDARPRAQRPRGSIGAVGCFSFYPTKNLGAYGDAGMVTRTTTPSRRRSGFCESTARGPSTSTRWLASTPTLTLSRPRSSPSSSSRLDDWSGARQRIADSLRSICSPTFRESSPRSALRIEATSSTSTRFACSAGNATHCRHT